MAYLVLDLDETIVLHRGRTIDPYHTLSAEHKIELKFGNVREEVFFQVINPDELSQLIDVAFKKHSGVIILTSGFWPLSLRTILKDFLNISEESKQGLEQCPFYTPITDQKLLNMDVEQIRHLDKKTRLDCIIENKPELKNECFVVVDDSPAHIQSFKNLTYVKAILATTDYPSKDFYYKAEMALELFKKREANPEKRSLSNAELSSFFKRQKTTIVTPCSLRCEENLPLI